MLRLFYCGKSNFFTELFLLQLCICNKKLIRTGHILLQKGHLLKNPLFTCKFDFYILLSQYLIRTVPRQTITD